VEQIFKKKSVVNLFFNFTTDWIFFIFRVAFLRKTRAKSQPVRPVSASATATTNLFFRLKFFHR